VAIKTHKQCSDILLTHHKVKQPVLLQ